MHSQNLSSTFEKRIKELQKEYEDAEQRISEIKKELTKQPENDKNKTLQEAEISKIEEKQREIKEKLERVQREQHQYPSIAILTTARQLKKICKDNFPNDIIYISYMSKIRRLTDELNMNIQNKLVPELSPNQTIKINASNASSTILSTLETLTNAIAEASSEADLKQTLTENTLQGVRDVVLKNESLQNLKDATLEKAKSDIFTLDQLKDAISDKTLTEKTLQTLQDFILKGLVDDIFEKILINKMIQEAVLKKPLKNESLLPGLIDNTKQALQDKALLLLQNNASELFKNLQTLKDNLLKELAALKEMASQVSQNNTSLLLKNDAVKTKPKSPSLFLGRLKSVASSVGSGFGLFKKTPHFSIVRGQSMVEETLENDSSGKLPSTRPTRTTSVSSYFTSPAKYSAEVQKQSKKFLDGVQVFSPVLETLKNQIQSITKAPAELETKNPPKP